LAESRYSNSGFVGFRAGEDAIGILD